MKSIIHWNPLRATIFLRSESLNNNNWLDYESIKFIKRRKLVYKPVVFFQTALHLDLALDFENYSQDFFPVVHNICE